MPGFEEFIPTYINFADPNIPDIVAASAFTLWISNLLHNDSQAIKKNEANFGVDLGINGPAIDHMAAIVDKKTKAPVTDQYFEGRQRLTNRTLVLGGLAALALVAAIHPTTETKEYTPQMNVGAVIASSYSDTLTMDMTISNHPNISRFQSAKDAFVSSSYDGSLSVTEIGSGIPDVVYALGADSRDELRDDIDPLSTNNQDGNCLVSGMQAAAKTGVIGELLVVSDGVNTSSTCSGDVPSLSQEAKKLKKAGIAVKVIVPGTKRSLANYIYAGSSPNQADIDPQVFTSVFGKENVKKAKALREMKADVNSDEKLALPKQISGSGKETNYFPYLLPVAAIVVGLFLDRVRVRKSLVTNLSN